MQFHSTPVSEPVALVSGLALGLISYGLARALQVEPSNAQLIANFLAIGTTVVVGGKINLVLLDVLGFLIARPLTGYGTHLILNHLTA